MGAILNRFDKLMELKESPEYANKYKLTAVIVHDPNDHVLCDHIREHFLDFAKITGRNFLFITFIQPPKKFIEGLSNNKFSYARYLISDREQGADVEKVIAPQLRKLYDIESDGSYLILAEKLLDSRYYKIPITTASLPYQLMDIKDYCDAPSNLDELIKGLQGEVCNSKEQLVDSLLKLVSLISPPPRSNEYSLYFWKQKETALETIKEEKQKLLSSLKCLDEDQTESIINLYSLIEYSYKKVFANDSAHTPKLPGYSKLDGKSKKFLDTCERLMNNISEDSRDELDYSAFTLYFGKIVESELNLSVGQMLRHSMGIEMPKYYNRHCPSIGSISIPTLMQRIPINKRTKGKDKSLETVPLGNLLHAYKTALGLEMPAYTWQLKEPKYLIELPSEIIEFWENFAEVRNEAAHTGIVDDDAFEIAYSKFKLFLSSYLGCLFSIKSNLKPKSVK